MNRESPQVEMLKARLENLGSNYICNTPLPDSTASVVFLGQFQGKTVVWNMTIETLAHCRLTKTENTPIAQQRFFNCPFIEIQEDVDGTFRLGVGLDLAVIDAPVISKTIIMIRNYKRLAIGKIHFGMAGG